MTPQEFDFDTTATKAPKLSRQCALILELFKRQGEVTNVEMADVAKKYTCRVSDLRAKNYEIRPVRKGMNGIVYYEWLNRPAVTR